MKCEYCGYDNPKNVGYCGFCGVETTYKRGGDAERKEQGQPVYEDMRYEEQSAYEEAPSEQPIYDERSYPNMEAYQRAQKPREEQPRQDRAKWDSRAYRTSNLPQERQNTQLSLPQRVKHRMPVWLKIWLIILLISSPQFALVVFIIWWVIDTDKNKGK